MYRIAILISFCVSTVLSNSTQNRGPDSHYLTPEQYADDFLTLAPKTNFTDCYHSTDGDNIYRYWIPHLNSSLPNITFSEFKGKPLIIVNVATHCGLVIEYLALNKLKEQFGDDLVIVGFPNSLFLNQEPSNNAEDLYNGIKYVKPGNGFVPKFPLTEKIEVNGLKAHPIYSYLKRSCPSTRTGFMPKEYLLYDPKTSRDIRWNFEKFLIDPKTGQPIRRYDAFYSSANIAQDIRPLIAQKH